MRLLIRMSRCTHGVHLSRFKLTQPRLLWLDHRLTLSAALRRKRQSTGVRPSVQPAPAFPLSSPGATVSVLPCSPLRGLSVVCAHSTTGRARTFTHTPVACQLFSRLLADTNRIGEDPDGDGGRPDTDHGPRGGCQEDLATCPPGEMEPGR